MLLNDTFHSALKGVTVNANRSMLTMLGIIIGVGSVVLMSSVGQSMQGVILGQISSLGPKSMVIFPGQENGGPNGVSTGFDSLTFEDLRELEQLKTIEDIAPVIFITGTVSYGRAEGAPQVFGVKANFFRNQNIVALTGRLLDSDDNDGAKAVAVLAPDVVEKYFGSIDPLGKRIKIGDRHYTVIGTTKALGSQFFQNADDRIYVPFTVARDVTGQKYLNYATMQATALASAVASHGSPSAVASHGSPSAVASHGFPSDVAGDPFALAFDDVKALLRRRHGIDNPSDDPKKDDFVVRSSAQAGEILGSVSLGLTLFITTIAAISLLVGGIGIMNIMLVSVTERTGEIGLRKALGAKRKDILLQFLTESVLLTMIGGLIGVIGGIFIAFVIAGIAKYFLDTYFFAVSLQSVAAAFLMAAFTGVVFGLSPARHAASLHPIEALRYE